ncbi:MAG: nitrilase-related carbon-nitrogen hydrolase [Dongiaceae bacterium]
MTAEPVETVTVALWAANLATKLNGIAAWIATVDQQLAEAKAAGARILVMPEFVSEHWLSYAPSGLKITEEIPWMAEQGEAALAALQPLAARYDMAILAGTMPVKADNGRDYLNRAWLLLPDGRAIPYDKVVLTPGEKNPEAWNLVPGDKIQIVEWHGLRIAPLVCLDVEMPALAHRLASLDLDLILVPSMTGFRSGFRRVFDCAKARAVELQTVVCTVGAIGVPEHLQSRESNVSGAAAYTPCEAVLGYDGVAGAIGPFSETEGPGPMLIARDLPVGTVRRLRHGHAEVWPGPWSAEHLAIETHSSRKN